MKFSELLELDFDRYSGIISIPALKDALPNTPDSVLEQWYSDHGRKEEFQEQYEDIEIDKISWNKIQVTASNIIKCRYYEDDRQWLSEPYIGIADEIINNGWNNIDEGSGRSEVIQSWKQHKTWVTPPVFIDGNILCLEDKYRLIEGHTRVRLLINLVESDIVSPESLHEIWYATVR